MPTTLITGAGRGLGLEFARQYAEDGWTVLAGVRDADAMGRLMAFDGDISPVTIDIADPASVTIMAERLRGIPIDLLISNAGIFGPRGMPIGDWDFAAWREVLEVNLIGTLRTAEAFLDHVMDGEGKKMAFVSSLMGSMTDNTSGGAYAYRSSKAALNAAVRSLSIDLASDDMILAILNPGWVRTDMGGPAASIGVEESVRGMRQVLAGLSPAETGRFWHYDGRELPW